MKIESYVLKQTQCPECARLGRDNSADNLATYSDGHQYCFSCHYHTLGDKITSYKQSNTRKQIDVPNYGTIPIPEDADFSYPDRALRWIEQYDLTRNTLLKHNVVWSEKKQMLIFPYYNNNVLWAWQGRYFGTITTIPKWTTYGKIQRYNYVLGRKTKRVVLTEDIVSAIKVSRLEQAIPIFGSTISKKRFISLSKEVTDVLVWLDPDKRKEGVLAQELGALYGLRVSVILTDKDPKEETLEKIQEILDSKPIT